MPNPTPRPNPRRRSPRSASVLLLLAVSFAVSLAAAEPLPIAIDGLFGDWEGVAPLYSDATGDGGASGIDLGRLWAADDPRFLFLRFEIGTERLLNDGHSLTLYLDTDADEGTGLPVAGIGAELAWRFGTREGTYYRSGQSWGVAQVDIRFRAAPTVSATSFEIAVGRDTEPNGSDPLFFGTEIRIALRDEQGGGDRLPDDGEIVSYLLDDGTLPPDVSIPFGKERSDDLRITTWNVKTDSPWDGGQTARFGRIVSTVAPAILNFQEIYDHSPAQTAALVEDWLPSGQGESWYAAGNNDCQTISRYPVEGTWDLDGNLAVLLDTTPVLATKLLIVNAHLPCCSNDDGRQQEIDRILSFLRDAKSPGGQIDLPDATPFLITGDLNLVGLSQQLTSLLTGDIVDEQTYGSDFDPDWDGTPLANLVSRQTEMRMAYTWRNDWSSYWPGLLDYMIYSDSVLQAANHYVVYTPEMSPDSLAAHGLQSDDSWASDHLIVSADFRPAGPSGHDGEVDDLRTQVPLRIVPNPARDEVLILLDLPGPAQVLLEVFDPSGRRVATPLGPAWVDVPAGLWSHAWQGLGAGGERLPAGTYVIRLRGRDDRGPFTATGKWTVLR